jgi:chemotaxis protein CheZ
VQNRVFRVERMFGGPAPRPAAASKPGSAAIDDSAVAALQRDLARLQDIFAHQKRELVALMTDGHERRMAHAAGKLGAAVDGMEKATVKILKSSEVIDESAKALAASLKTDYERGLAQEIQENVVKIYEACNFQDLAGQRIGNVIATLGIIEDRLAALLDPSKAEPPKKTNNSLLNGPRLDGSAGGHKSQSDIDAIFD